MNNQQEIQNESLIYQSKDGEIELRFDKNNETILANLNQIAEIFGVGKAAISKHLKNIFQDGELEENSTVSILETAQIEGNRNISRNIQFYNLDAIISVGYRVNSKQATNFRKWATKILKQHIANGFTINKKMLKENHEKFLKAIDDIKALSKGNEELKSDDILELIKSFSYTWFSLDNFDKSNFPTKGTKKSINITAGGLEQDIEKLKTQLIAKKEATEIFAMPKHKDALAGILGNVFQSAFGADVYESLEEKAANLLYFIIKNHPFNDGNKRSGAFAFIWFLKKASFDFEEKISPQTLASLTILIANSNPKEKEKMIGLVLMMLEKYNN